MRYLARLNGISLGASEPAYVCTHREHLSPYWNKNFPWQESVMGYDPFNEDLLFTRDCARDWGYGGEVNLPW